MHYRLTAILLTLALTACSPAVESADTLPTDDGAQPYDPEPDADAGETPAPDAGAPAQDAATAADAAAPDASADAAQPAPDASTAPDSAAEPDAAPDAAPPVEPDSAAPCTASTWYLDADSDGHGDPATAVSACEAPAGYIDVAGDCYDGNAEARPGQTARFSVHRGDGSFDYDCDGAAEPSAGFAVCPELDQACPPPSEWPAGFSCDYAGMMAAARAQLEGWSPYQYFSCSAGSCTPIPLALPACGAQGLYGMRITWSEGKGYECLPPANAATAQQVQTCN